MRAWIVGVCGFIVTVAVGLLLLPGRSAEQPPNGAPPQQAVAEAPKGETINIPTLGLTVVRPAGWWTITTEENVANIRGVEMDDRQLQELAARYATAPIVAFSKYKEPYEDLNPSFKINVRSIGGFAGHAPDEILLAAVPTLRRMFGDLTMENAPTRTTVAGKPAAYTRFAYTLRAGGKSFPAVSEVWVVPHGPVFFMIGAGTRADERNGSRAEVRKILEAVRIN